MSQVRQNFNEECEAGINKQINMELYASYTYMAMACHFDRDDVSLKGFHKFFRKLSDEERGQAQKLMDYQNMRGGRIVLQDIKTPGNEWSSGVDAMEDALQLERKINQALLDLHQCACLHNDPQMSDFVEDHFLKEQVESIKEIANHLTNLKRAGSGLGEFLFDKETLQEL